MSLMSFGLGLRGLRALGVSVRAPEAGCGSHLACEPHVLIYFKFGQAIQEPEEISGKAGTAKKAEGKEAGLP